jgi:5-methyltetrahydrofolate--homocysteine methyltransferase
MQTCLKSASKEAIINTHGPFVVIGEKINPTGRKKLAEALQANHFDYVRDLAIKQVEAGADVLDVNVGVPGIDEVALMPQVVKAVSEAVDVPLCLDSANPQALAAGLAAMPGRALVNSVNGEERTLASVLPIVKEYGAAVIGLTMDDSGIPNDPEVRVAIADKILNRAAQLGIGADSVVIDPLVMAVGADSSAASITLRTIEMVQRAFGVNVNLGASNVSFGLPDRHTLNQVFLAMAIGAGASCAITDPMKLTSTIRAADLIRGRDGYAKRYIKYLRAHPVQKM